MKDKIEPSMPLHRFLSKLLSRLCGVADSADPRERRAFFSLAVLKGCGVTHIETRLPSNYLFGSRHNRGMFLVMFKTGEECPAR